jgi:hypothetical protein
MKKIVSAAKAMVEDWLGTSLSRTDWPNRVTLSRALNEVDPRYKIRPEGQLHLNTSEDPESPSYSPQPIGRIRFVEGLPPGHPDLWIVEFQVGVMPETCASYVEWEISPQPFSDFSLAMRYLWQNRAKCQPWF